MQNPEYVLEQLGKHACNPSYKYSRLYRYLYNPEFYLLAYSHLSKNAGAMTSGADGLTIDGMSEKRIEKLIANMRDLSYRPKPARRVVIPKDNGKTRTLGLPGFEDKMVQEIVRMILEAIWEPLFLDCSHGFRPERSCHIALAQVTKLFKGTKWFIEGDIKGCFDNIDHHVLIDLVRRRIDDEKFIDLLWKMLRAGYMDDWRRVGTYSGTPQGSIVSPVLANIYLHELDKFVTNTAEEFWSGKRRANNHEYDLLARAVRAAQKELKTNEAVWTPAEIKAKRDEIADLTNRRNALPSQDPYDPNFRRLNYVRYADDFLIGVIGSKEDARKIKSEIGMFLKEQLHLVMSDEKTLITHGHDFARFLGYEVSTRNDNGIRKNKDGVAKRAFSGNVLLQVPKSAWVKRLLGYGALKIKYVNGKEVYEPVHRPALQVRDDLEILSQYNSEIRGLYNYYRLANNVSVLSKFAYVMEYSMYKTFAGKYRTTISKIKAKYRMGKDFAVQYETKTGKKNTAVFYNKGFVRNTRINDQNPDRTPVLHDTSTSLIDRLKAHKCEWCGKETDDIEMHHVHKLKDLKGKKAWERRMIERNRKTIALCRECHDKLHAGKLD
ncbi:MAG: group II intron reverse transcriptase/maturase [Clostridia bacterium]|nr:group II intron reverse transcriptase/maturase [Clostridia bacterium]